MKNKNYYYLLLFALLAVSIASLAIGPDGFSFLFLRNPSDTDQAILRYRFTRLVLALMAGSSLAASGASLQAIFRNPLADPHLFGVSGGAALGASLVIAFFAQSSFLAPSVGAVIGSFAAFLLIFFYLHKSADRPLSHSLLVGILINSLAASLITLLKTILPAHKTQNLLYWLVGHFTAVSPKSLLLGVPLWLLGIAMLWSIKGELELLSFGADESRILGVDANRILKKAVIANCLLIGNVVSFAGMIGFLGLVIPHFIRLTTSADLRYLLPSATVAGAAALIFFDGLSRLGFFFMQTEIPVGALVALFLSPIFFFLLLRTQHED